SGRKRLLGVALLAAFIVLAGWTLVRGGHPVRPRLASSPGRPAAAPPQTAHRPRRTKLLGLRVARSALLAAPLQDAAAVRFGGSSLLLAGGLTAADTSSAAITVFGPSGARVLGRLPGPLHDAAAARLGGVAYV